MVGAGCAAAMSSRSSSVNEAVTQRYVSSRFGSYEDSHRDILRHTLLDVEWFGMTSAYVINVASQDATVRSLGYYHVITSFSKDGRDRLRSRLCMVLDIHFVPRMEASHLRLLVVILCYFLLLSVNSSGYTRMNCEQQCSQFAAHQEFTRQCSRCTMRRNSVCHQVTSQSRLHGSIFQLGQSSFHDLHGSFCKAVRGWMVSW